VKKMFLLTMFVFFTLHLNPVFILVHGTWQAYDLASFDVEIAGLRILRWSGYNTHEGRILAAADLAKIVLGYYYQSPTEPVILIGHSHGGNVINFASRLLGDPFVKSVKTRNLNKKDFDENVSTTEIKETKNIATEEVLFEANELDLGFSLSDDKYTNIEDTKQLRQLPDFMLVGDHGTIPSSLEDEIAQAQAEIQFEREALEKQFGVSGKEYQIDFAIGVGTPICETNYAPNMDVISKYILIWSLWHDSGISGPDPYSDWGDYMQPLGSYVVENSTGQTYPLHDRLTNIRVKKKIGSSYHDPYHCPISGFDDDPGNPYLTDSEIYEGLITLLMDDSFYGSNQTAYYKDGSPLSFTQY
jgi:hypothetical protein